MFKRKTVFILGAGASWHYGYPTGEDLVRKVIGAANRLAEVFNDSANRTNPHRPKYVARRKATAPTSGEIRSQWIAAKEECQNLARRLRQVNPLVIDYFLGQNPSLQDIGKFLISWVIMECEELYLRMGGNANRIQLREYSGPIGGDNARYKDDWYRFILHKLIMGCVTSTDLLKNNVTFITFNYDVSFENAVGYALAETEVFQPSDVFEFVSEERIIHCYGTIRKSHGVPHRTVSFEDFFKTASHATRPEIQQHDEARRALLDEVFEGSKLLKTIDPMDKTSNACLMAIAQKAIREASIVYILGYGFDEQNPERLQLSDGLSPDHRQAIMFTNFCDSNRVNKKAARVLGLDVDTFVAPRPPRLKRPSGEGYVEKSIRDTYQALELDFDELEETDG